MEVKTWTFQTEDLEALLNDGKLYYLSKMVEEKIITREQADLMAYYAITIVIKEQKRFGSWLTNLIFNKKIDKEPTSRFAVVKVFYEKEIEEPSNHIKEEIIDAEQAN